MYVLNPSFSFLYLAYKALQCEHWLQWFGQSVSSLATVVSDQPTCEGVGLSVCGCVCVCVCVCVCRQLEVPGCCILSHRA